MPAKKWTPETLRNEAGKYGSRREFRLTNASAYVTCRKSGLLEEIFPFVVKDHAASNNPNFRWTDDALRLEALKYTTKQEFRNNSYAAYLSAKRRGIFITICSHMNSPYQKWTNESLKLEASKYNRRSDFERESPAAYGAATIRKIMSEICVHMQRSCCISTEQNDLATVIVAFFPSAKSIRFWKVKIPDKPQISAFEIDIYIPELKKGIEFDGTYWHSLKGMRRGRPHWSDEDLLNYGNIKDSYFKTIGISILHVKQEDWKKNSEECIRLCFNFLMDQEIGCK